MARKKEKKGETNSGAATVVATPVAGEVSPTPVQEEQHKLLSKSTFERLASRAPKILKYVLGSLGNTARLEVEGAIPEAERLARDEDGTVSWAEVEKLIVTWESKNGGEGSAAYPLTEEARQYYQANQLFQVFRDYNEVFELVGKFGGLTVEDLAPAVEKKQAVLAEERQAREKYEQLLDCKDNGPRVICGRCGHQEFQPRSSYLVINDERRQNKDGREIRVGNFRVRKNPQTGVPELIAVDNKCQAVLRQKAREAGKPSIYFEPREDAEARLERIMKGIEKVHKQDSFDESLFAEAKTQMDRQRKRRDSWAGQKPGGDRERRPDRRGERRGGSGPYRGRSDE